MCFISFGFLLATICVWVWMVCSLHSVTTGSRDRANVSLIILYEIITYRRWASTSKVTDLFYCNVAILPVVTKDLSISPRFLPTNVYRDVSPALFHLNRWLNFTSSRFHAFRYRRQKKSSALILTGVYSCNYGSYLFSFIAEYYPVFLGSISSWFV